MHPADAVVDEAIETDAVEPSVATEERAVLIVVSGPDRGQRLELDREQAWVGKSRTCDLVLTDPKVSRHHLQVSATSTGLLLRDGGSKNGSYYRGARFDSLRVPIGGLVQVGDTQLLVGAPTNLELAGSEREQFGRLQGRSRAMRRLFATLERISRASLPVLIMGETGTGKELTADAVHRASPRADRPFVVCDLAAMSPTLIEAELFGHVRGAFTGADRERPGAFELAHGGTIFLDEVGELDAALQPRLLRALDTGQVKRVGEGRYRTVDVRVIAATNRDLGEEVRAGRFRADLYHRLAGGVVQLPPLRKRLDDLELLVPTLLEELSARLGRTLRMSSDAIAALQAYDWPGNLRQLRNVLESAAAGSAEDGLVHVPPVVELVPSAPSAPAPAVDLGISFKVAKERLLQEWELEYVTRLLARCEGNVALAARRAGVDRVHFHRLLRKHGLQRTPRGARADGADGAPPID